MIARRGATPRSRESMSKALAGTPAPPPPPLPPPPPAPGLQGHRLLKAALEQADPGDQDGIQELLKRRKARWEEAPLLLRLLRVVLNFWLFWEELPSTFVPRSLRVGAQLLALFGEEPSSTSAPSSLSCSRQDLFAFPSKRFSEHLKWLLFNNPVPSLIQEGPQCGLVALWMSGALLSLPRAVSLERIVQVALERGYTAQGEMFSAADMAKLALEVFPCQTELLSGGLEGENRKRILRHLSAGFPVLIPYDEDSNHEPCFRGGYKAHWAIASGALLGLKCGSQLPPCQEDKEIPGLFHTDPCVPSLPLDAVVETYLLSKQGKSCRYQLWSYALLQESNAQLTDFSPKRAADGKVYIVPAGGVREGLCGKAVLLQPGGSESPKPC